MNRHSNLNGTRCNFSAIGTVRDRRVSMVAALACVLAFAPAGRASITGTISGIVTDPSGAVVPAASVVALEKHTGVQQTTTTDSRGFYSFPQLSIGEYEVTIRKEGFKPYKQTGLVIDINTALRVDATLQVGAVTQEVTVSSTAVQVSTTSTQLGEVITGTKISTIPLNGRSYTDLLALQPGVAPQPSGAAIVYTNPGTISGELSPGGLSVNGQREAANGFSVNGARVNEPLYQDTSVVPNLDSIAEFRILTGNFDAEHGNYGGGQVIVVTKSGTNQFHGGLFEFVRNDKFDARNFFSPALGSFKQNQFGSTLGGPIRQNKAFFFVDYQGTRNVIGADSGNILVPSAADRTGDLSDRADQLTGTVGGSSWANMLSQELGYPVAAGEPYYAAGCTSPAQCVFPNAFIPQSAFSAPAGNLLKYIPLPNSGSFFTTSSYKQTLRDDKGSVRTDINTRWGALSAYYSADDFRLVNPYVGGNLPGFAGENDGRAQLFVLSDTKSLGASALNELRMSFMRNALFQNAPAGGVGPKLSSFGFVEGCNTLGICPLNPSYEGVPSIGLNNFSFGVTSTVTKTVDNIFQWQDNYSKVIGTHTLKFGGDFHYDQVNLIFVDAQGNGSFGFSGAETGLDFADFLIGAPTTYAQGVPEVGETRFHYLGLYGQDSWRARSNLTLNYGLRWDVSQFPYFVNNEVDTFIPGEQSLAFPGAPTGLVFPGDPGVPRTVAPTHLLNLAPRIGLAYSPAATSGILKKLTGGPGKSSLRLGYGMFYTEIESVGVQIGENFVPFGFFYVSPVPPLFATPYIDRATGNSEGQRFPPPLPSPPSPSHPQNNINFANFEPIVSQPVMFHGDQVPYTESYSASLQRQFGSDTLMTLTYAGAQGHRLMTGLEANPGSPALCLSLSQTSQVAPGSLTCGPFLENGVFTTASGQVINGTRGPLGPAFGSDAYYDTLGNSNYNALEATLKHRSGRLEFLAGYTYGKSLDNASGLSDQVYPFNHALTKSLSQFDTTHNFVVSYSYTFPFEKLVGHNRAAGGWSLAGTTRFSTGFPVTLGEADDNSLIGTYSSGLGGDADVPDYTSGTLHITDPRSGLAYFNTSLFSPEQLGQFGTANRRFFHGPGLNNFDMALHKEFRLTESKRLEFRAEWFNIFNHAQFNGPDGNITDGANFGLVNSARRPRIGQLALKFKF